MKENDICRYCGGVIKLIPAGAVYGESTRRLGMEGEFVYQCQNCNARVGCHKGTTRAHEPDGGIPLAGGRAPSVRGAHPHRRV